MADIKRKVPNLRFKGFTDDWEQRKLGDVVNLIGGGPFKSTDSVSKGIPWLKIANVGVNGITWNTESYLPEYFWNDYPQYQLKKGNYVVALTRPILNHRLKISKLDRDALLNQRVAKLTTSENLQYIVHLLERKKVVLQIENNLSGSDPPNLSSKDLYRIKIKIPSESNEQKQIGIFLQNIDHIIALQQRKLELLKEIKKGLLQKMFADKDSKQPVLRFKGFHDDWEQRKLGDIALFSKGKGISKKDLQTHGIYNIVHYADVYKFMPVQDKVLHHSNNKMGVRIGSNSLLFAGSDVTPKGLARTTAIKQENVRVGGDVIIADLSEKHLNYFMSYEINMNKRFIYPFITGSTVRHIHGSDLSHLNITFPSLSEQKNIAHIFNLIEHELSLLKIKKSKYQSIKKSLLQQMFI